MIGLQVLKDLKNEFPDQKHDRYIDQLEFDEKSSRSNLAVFYAPNLLIGNWAKTKYSEKMAHLFEIRTGVKTIVKIGLKSSKAAGRKKQNINEEQYLKNVKSTILNPSYTFDSFVVGSSNEVAFSVAKNIAKKPGLVYNPVFFYGPTGLGKTHLIQAIGNQAQESGKIVIYATSEQFMNDFTYNLQNQTPDRFREKYRQCDILIIDDIQFLANKIQTQEEFFHTFNDLHTNKSQIILTSDKPPKMINGLEDRLKSRFEWGLLADISIPELETKIAITKKKCELNNINLSSEIVNYIASNMGDNIREIESAIINLNSYASIMNQEITLEFTKNLLRDQIKQKKENTSLEEIISIISKEFNIKISDIKSKKRSKDIVNARRIAIYIARSLTPNSTPELAKFFGMKDHSAILHNIKKVDELKSSDEYYKLKIKELENKILSKGKQ